MAEEGTWLSISQNGLLSTSAILDLHKVESRASFESQHRPSLLTINSQNGPNMVLRDQKPMPPLRLEIALKGTNISTTEWYEYLNSRVFMWATRKRLETLLSAREYRNKRHDVLTIDTASFVQQYAERILLCHINSGSTYRVPTKRDFSIFKPIHAYEAWKNGNPIKPVAEVTVDYAIPDMRDYVIQVERMVGADAIEVIWER